MSPSSISERPLRADAERNRRRVLDAAREAFAARGMNASVEEVARAAGVGVGTVYRRFPDKEALMRAVMVDRTEFAAQSIEAAAAEHEDPEAALRAALSAWIENLMDDRGLFDAVQDALPKDCFTDLRERLYGAIEPPLERARAAGAVRDDIYVGDITLLLGGLPRVARIRPELGPRQWERSLALVLDGLRPEGARPLPHQPRARRARG